MASLISIILILVAMGFVELLKMALTHQSKVYVDQDSYGDDQSHEPLFNYARAHFLIVERAHIDEMIADMRQYEANEHWKNKVAQYKIDFSNYNAEQQVNVVSLVAQSGHYKSRFRS